MRHGYRRAAAVWGGAMAIAALSACPAPPSRATLKTTTRPAPAATATPPASTPPASPAAASPAVPSASPVGAARELPALAGLDVAFRSIETLAAGPDGSIALLGGVTDAAIAWIGSDGKVRALAGDGGAEQLLREAMAIDVDPRGRLVGISGKFDHAVWRLTAAGAVEALAKGSDRPSRVLAAGEDAIYYHTGGFDRRAWQLPAAGGAATALALDAAAAAAFDDVRDLAVAPDGTVLALARCEAVLAIDPGSGASTARGSYPLAGGKYARIGGGGSLFVFDFATKGVTQVPPGGAAQELGPLPLPTDAPAVAATTCGVSYPGRQLIDAVAASDGTVWATDGVKVYRHGSSGWSVVAGGGRLDPWAPGAAPASP